MQASKTVSVLVVSRNVVNLNSLLKDIAKSRLPGIELDVLLSWNGTKDDEDKIQSHEFQVRIACREPYHFASNMNKLAQVATGTYLCLLNDDLILDRDAIKNAVNWLAYDGVGLVGACLSYPNGTIQHCGVFLETMHRLITFIKRKIPKKTTKHFVS